MTPAQIALTSVSACIAMWLAARNKQEPELQALVTLVLTFFGLHLAVAIPHIVALSE